MVADYEWSGYILTTLLPYLEERHQIDLMKSEFDGLSAFLVEKRGATHFIFTDAHKRDYLQKLAPDTFSEEQLRDYYNEFNETHDPEVGKPMVDGIRAFQQSLRAVNESSVSCSSSGEFPNQTLERTFAPFFREREN